MEDRAKSRQTPELHRQNFLGNRLRVRGGSERSYLFWIASVDCSGPISSKLRTRLCVVRQQCRLLARLREAYRGSELAKLFPAYLLTIKPTLYAHCCRENACSRVLLGLMQFASPRNGR